MPDMQHPDAVTRMQNYISDHLADPITLHDLAKVAGYSPWYSAKLFKEYTGKTPFGYIRMLRLSRAALVLRDENRKVIDVALDFVFDSHEGFTRAFQKQFGLPPKQYQQTAPPVPLFNPYPVREYYQMQLQRKDLPPLSMNYHVHIMHYPARKLILKRGKDADNYFDYSMEIGCDVWGMLISIKEALYEPIGMWLPKRFRPDGTSIYAQGVEVPADYKGAVPDGYDIIDLPPCSMMMFQGDPFEEDRFYDAVLSLTEVMNHYNPSVDGYAWDEDAAPRIQMEPQGYRGYIEARPVKPIE